MVTDMDGARRIRTNCAKLEPEAHQMMMLKNGNNKHSHIPERVTLKKEIGLLSACAIIIGKLEIIF